MLKTLARADALILRAALAPALPEGAEVEVDPAGRARHLNRRPGGSVEKI